MTDETRRTDPSQPEALERETTDAPAEAEPAEAEPAETGAAETSPPELEASVKDEQVGLDDDVVETVEPVAGSIAEDQPEVETVVTVSVEQESIESEPQSSQVEPGPVGLVEAPTEPIEVKAESAATEAAGAAVVEEAAVASEAPTGDQFTWHPEYAGKQVSEVREELARQIASDQRQHSLAMEGAEEAEQDALASVVSLERRWGVYDFDWADQDANALADRIVAFELERERRREMLTWADYRTEGYAQTERHETHDRPAPELATGVKALSLLLVVLLILLILLSVWAL